MRNRNFYLAGSADGYPDDHSQYPNNGGWIELTPEMEKLFEGNAPYTRGGTSNVTPLRPRRHISAAEKNYELSLQDRSRYKDVSAKFLKTQEAAHIANIKRLISDAALVEITMMQKDGLLDPDFDLKHPEKVKFIIKDEQIRGLLVELGYMDEDAISGDLTSVLAARLLKHPLGNFIVNKSTRYIAFEALQEEAENYLGAGNIVLGVEFGEESKEE